MDPSMHGFEVGSPGAPLGPPLRGGGADPSARRDDSAREPDEGDETGNASPPGLVGHSIDSMDDEALARLIGRVMRQDEDALAQLYEQLSGRVYAVALRITRKVACAEEVMQDTFWQVWRQAPRFDPLRGSAVAWVLMMARSRALDAIRARARDPAQGIPAAEDDEESLADAAAEDPLDLLQAVQRNGALHAQLAKLDPLRRQLIALAFFRGMSQDEIAVHTGLPLGTVKSHFRRTLAALQSALGADFCPDGMGGSR